jgi:hypothetical protein
LKFLSEEDRFLYQFNNWVFDTFGYFHHANLLCIILCGYLFGYGRHAAQKFALGKIRLRGDYSISPWLFCELWKSCWPSWSWLANTWTIVDLPRDSRPWILRLSHERHIHLQVVSAECGTLTMCIGSLQHHWLSTTWEIFCRELRGHKWPKSSSGNLQPQLRVSTCSDNFHYYSFIISNQTRCWARSRWLYCYCSVLDVYGWCLNWG